MTTFHDSKNPTDDMMVKADADGKFYIAVKTYCECGHECCSRPETGDRPHTSIGTFEDADEAHEYLDSLSEKYEEDYDNYLEENHDAIAQMERYEMWRNEY